MSDRRPAAARRRAAAPARAPALSTLTAIVAGLVASAQGRARVARLEFADYRPYVAGDELRRIDWNIYRRLRQLVVKVGAEDGRLSLVLLIDTSRSMRVGQPSKFRAAQRMAAALAAIALLRGDQAEVHALGDGRSRSLVRLDGPRQITAARARARAAARVARHRPRGGARRLRARRPAERLRDADQRRARAARGARARRCVRSPPAGAPPG